MRIKIITLPLKTNFGGLLQAYALQKVLKKMGHSVVTIDLPHHYSYSWLKILLLFPIRVVKKYIFHAKEGVFREAAHNKYYPIISQNTEPFINNYISREETLRYPRIKRGSCDCILVGSDQIWRRIYHKKIEPLFLDFAKGWNIKRIAYAASFGTDEWEYSETETRNCANLISLFDAVSVRERTGVDLCRQKFDCKACEVLDPTLLLSKSDYEEIFLKKEIPQSCGNLLVYMLDPSEEKNRIVTAISKYKGLKAFAVNSDVDNNSVSLECRIQPSVETWLRGFYDASYVVTDSFHACVFSIIFHKPFVVYGNKKRGMSRFKTLLEKVGLQDRLVFSENDIEMLINKDIDFKSVDDILNQDRERSVQFLGKALSL